MVPIWLATEVREIYLFILSVPMSDFFCLRNLAFAFRIVDLLFFISNVKFACVFQTTVVDDITKYCVTEFDAWSFEHERDASRVEMFRVDIEQTNVAARYSRRLSSEWLF